MTEPLPLNEEKMSREVYCPRCKKETITSNPIQSCSECGVVMVKLVRSIITGKRIEKSDYSRFDLDKTP